MYRRSSYPARPVGAGASGAAGSPRSRAAISSSEGRDRPARRAAPGQRRQHPPDCRSRCGVAGASGAAGSPRSRAAISSSERPRSASEKGCTWPAATASSRLSISGAGAGGASGAAGSPKPKAAISSSERPRSASEKGCTWPAATASSRLSISGAGVAGGAGCRRAWLRRSRRARRWAEAIAAHLIAAGILEDGGVAGIVPDRSGAIPVQVGPVVDAAPRPQPYQVVCSKQERREHKTVLGSLCHVVSSGSDRPMWRQCF